MTRHEGGTPSRANQKAVNLALQDGGAHGAFAWGVLDKLLEDGRLTIDAMSATSAGAMNAVVAAYGLSIGGMDGARVKLGEFWRQISNAGQLYSPVQTFPWEKWLQGSVPDLELSPAYLWIGVEKLTTQIQLYQQVGMPIGVLDPRRCTGAFLKPQDIGVPHSLTHNPMPSSSFDEFTAWNRTAEVRSSILLGSTKT